MACTLATAHATSVELAVAIAKGGVDLSAERALDHVFGYAVALDMTRRDLQSEAKEQRRPWDMAKGFDASCPIGPITPVASFASNADAVIRLTLDGAVRQESTLGAMIWSVAESLAHLSRLVRIEPGDILLTGTPAGVGAVAPGQDLRATCDGLEPLAVRYKAV